MSVTVFAPGVAVEVRDGEPVPTPQIAPGAGMAIVYTGGHAVEVRDAAPPPPDLGVINLRTLNPASTIWFRDLDNGDRYTRNVPNVRLPRAAGVTIPFACDDATWSAANYTVTCDGVPVGSMARPTTKYAVCTVDLSGIPDGVHLFDLVPDGGHDTTVPLWHFVGNVSAATQTFAPAQAGSFDINKKGGSPARWVKVPAQLDPQVAAVGYPLAPRQWLPMTGHPSLALMYRRDLVPAINGDPPYLYTHASGVRTCMSPHAYALSTFFAKLPALPLRDGPRGIGLVAGAMHLQIGRRGGVYGLDAWRMFHVDPTGRVKTLLGWRHGATGLEMVGDWSAIPAERRGMHEAWGFAWDPRTTGEDTLDTSQLLDRGDGTMEHPHTVGPVVYITDTQNNRVLRAQFSPTDHAAAPVITEHITGLSDPWDVVYGSGRLYVSERLSHRIAAYDATTGAYIETIAQGAALSGVNKNRAVTVLGTLEQRRAEPCVGPEGLFRLGDWLYYGSRATEQVKRINLTTRAIEWVCNPYFDTSPNGSSFCKLAVRSDGTVFVSTWESAAKGGPRAYRPDGTAWSIQSGSSSGLKGGRGGNYADHGYNTSCAVDDYRVICAGADFGLVEISLALPSDPPLWDKVRYSAGEYEYEKAGYRLTHGVDGYGQFGYPLPWGKSAAMDYYLACHGHRPDGSYSA